MPFPSVEKHLYSVISEVTGKPITGRGRCSNLATVKKRKYRNKSKERIFDTSVCQAKFRKPRILQKRNRSFNEDRELFFDHNRKIEARLNGIVFRDTFAVGFRTTGLGNLDDIMGKKDWPDMPKASRPKTTKREKGPGYEKTWGQDRSFKQKWTQPEVGSEIITPGASTRGQDQYRMGARRDLQVSKKNRRDAYTYNEYALALMSDGDFKRSLSYFQRARALDPNEDIYRVNLERCQEWLRSKKGGS